MQNMDGDQSTLTVCVPMEAAQVVRKHLEQHKLWDSSRKLQRLEGMIAIPVHSYSEPHLLHSCLQDFPTAEIKQISLPPSMKASRKTEGRKLITAVQSLMSENNLSDSLIPEIPRKWERHGDLVILPSMAFSSPQWRCLGDKLWHAVSSSLSCLRLAQHSCVANDGFRTPQVSMLLGQEGKVMHIDNGIKYSFDVTKCMFSSGNITEKLRIASWDCSDETVVDLYAGIGYFTLPYLVHAKAKHVHACEWNPDAVTALRANLTLNGVVDRCTVHTGDNRQLQLSCVADRVNLGLIPSSEDGWRVAVRVLKPAGGMLHIHHNATVANSAIVTEQQDAPVKNCEESRRNCWDDGVGSVNYNNNNNSSGNEHSFGGVDYNDSDGGCVNNDSKNCGSDDVVDGDRRQTNIKRYSPWLEEASQKIRHLLEEEKGYSKGQEGGEWSGWCCDIVHVERVKSYAPHIDHIVLDLKCTPRAMR